MVLVSVLWMGAIGVAFGLLLVYASRVFAVKVDPRVEKLDEIVPGANCGGCGFSGCHAFAEALVEGKASPVGCSVGGPKLAQQAARILGVEVGEQKRKVAVVKCQGTPDVAITRARYIGPSDCRAAAVVGGGSKACQYGCLGLGSCVDACQFDAIRIGPGGIPVVDNSRCTGCGKCADACPRNVIEIMPEENEKIVVRCNSLDKGKDVRAVCQVGCISCGLCERNCPQQAIKVVDNLAKVDLDKCDGCGTCIEKCRPGTITRFSEQIGAKAPADQGAGAEEKAAS